MGDSVPADITVTASDTTQEEEKEPFGSQQTPLTPKKSGEDDGDEF